MGNMLGASLFIRFSLDSPSNAFGYSLSCSPGRFFAANELKAMLAHVVTTYDVKLENEGVVPEPLWVASALVPNPTAKVMFRKRQD